MLGHNGQKLDMASAMKVRDIEIDTGRGGIEKESKFKLRNHMKCSEGRIKSKVLICDLIT